MPFLCVPAAALLTPEGAPGLAGCTVEQMAELLSYDSLVLPEERLWQVPCVLTIRAMRTQCYRCVASLCNPSVPTL